MHSRQARPVRRALAAILGVFLIIGLGACTPSPDVAESPVPVASAVRDPGAGTMTLASADPAALALSASRLVFDQSPVLVIAALGDDDAAAALTAVSTALTAPALLADGPDDRAVRSEAERLGARLAVVIEEEPLAVEGVESAPSDAQATARAAGLAVLQVDPEVVATMRAQGGATGVAALRDDLREDAEQVAPGVVPADPPAELTEALALVDPVPGQEAALATLRAAGVVTQQIAGGDPGATSAAIQTVSDADALSVIGVGPSFADEGTFAWQVAAAEQGTLLPNGTQRLAQSRFAATAVRVGDRPDRILAATDDDLPAAALSDPDTPMPTVVLRASQRLWTAGPDGTYLRAESADALAPLIEAAHREGRYVVLEVEGGSTALLDQVAALDPLLAQGGVGVLVHPEQRRSGAGRDRGGAVTVAELNAVVDHLASLVTAGALPQILLAVHSLGTAVEGVDGLAVRPQVAVTDSTVLEGLQ